MAWVEQQHADAIIGLLTADVALVVYDGKVPDPPAVPAKQYVLVYFDTSTPEGTSLTSDQDRAITRAFCHCVGADAKASRAIAGRVAARLLNAKPSIAGRVPWPIRDDDSGSPPDRDETTGVLVMDSVSVYRLESVPS
jgi:hypothetical protein